MRYDLHAMQGLPSSPPLLDSAGTRDRRGEACRADVARRRSGIEPSSSTILETHSSTSTSTSTSSSGSSLSCTLASRPLTLRARFSKFACHPRPDCYGDLQGSEDMAVSRRLSIERISGDLRALREKNARLRLQMDEVEARFAYLAEKEREIEGRIGGVLPLLASKAVERVGGYGCRRLPLDQCRMTTHTQDQSIGHAIGHGMGYKSETKHKRTKAKIDLTLDTHFVKPIPNTVNDAPRRRGQARMPPMTSDAQVGQKIYNKVRQALLNRSPTYLRLQGLHLRTYTSELIRIYSYRILDLVTLNQTAMAVRLVGMLLDEVEIAAGRDENERDAYEDICASLDETLLFAIERGKRVHESEGWSRSKIHHWNMFVVNLLEGERREGCKSLGEVFPLSMEALVGARERKIENALGEFRFPCSEA